MTMEELARKIQEFLVNQGSTDTTVLAPAETAKLHGLSGKNPAVECKDRSIYYLCQSDLNFEELTLGDSGAWALPYNDHLIVCFAAD